MVLLATGNDDGGKRAVTFCLRYSFEPAPPANRDGFFMSATWGQAHYLTRSLKYPGGHCSCRPTTASRPVLDSP